MRISDWSSDVCSSDLTLRRSARLLRARSGASSVADQSVDISVEQRQLIHRHPSPYLVNDWKFCLHHARLLLFWSLIVTIFGRVRFRIVNGGGLLYVVMEIGRAHV